MNERIIRLCAYLDECGSFADVGCDHGYGTLYMLQKGLCKNAVISDISEKCLKKAEVLLSEYIDEGIVSSVCCDGLEKISEDTDQVLIAGMGGEEIVKILKNSFIPKKFVLQPMKNSRAVREYLLASGAEITYDGIFECAGKYYFIIKGNKKRSGKPQVYSEIKLELGTDLHCDAMRGYLKSEFAKKCMYLDRDMSPENRKHIQREISVIEGVLKGEIE